MATAEAIHRIGSFGRSFWIANVTELFERLSYYAVFSSLARYLHEDLLFTVQRASVLAGLFGGLVWFLAILGGWIADRLGFRRALLVAYAILSCSYFFLGSVQAPWLTSIRERVPLVTLMTVILALPALGIALVKPTVIAITARATDESLRAIGYSIYYTLVNIGAAVGPYVASWIHHHGGKNRIFQTAALSVLMMFLATLAWFPSSTRSGEVHPARLKDAVRAFGMVVSNARFMVFLLIFSGYWLVYWQEFIILPVYVHEYVDPSTDTELMLSTGALCIIVFTLFVNFLTRKIRTFAAILLGSLISALGWAVLVASRSVGAAYATLLLVAVGEITQSPRYYEYISRLAPSEQQGTYMGFAFLPVGIGSLGAGVFGGRLLHHFGEVTHRPQQMWWVVMGVALMTVLALWIYDQVGMSRAASETPTG